MGTPFDLLFKTGQRMTRNVETDSLFLKSQELVFRPLLDFWKTTLFKPGWVFIFKLSEYPKLSALLGLLKTLGFLHSVIQSDHHLGPAGPGKIEGPAFYQTFDDPLIDPSQIDPSAEIGERAIPPAFFSFRENRFDRSGPHILDGGETKADPIVYNGKISPAFIHIRRKDFDSHIPALGDVLDDLIGCVNFTRQQGGHEFHGIVGLEVGRLKGNERISGAMGLIETIFGELRHEFEDSLSRFRIDSLLSRSLEEPLPLFFHLSGYLFPHGTAQPIRIPETEVAEKGCNFHHLFLIDNDPISFAQ